MIYFIIYLVTLISIYSLIRGVYDFKVYMTFDEKNTDLLDRFAIYIGFGVSNLSVLYYYLIKGN
jgi:hypothetical protein